MPATEMQQMEMDMVQGMYDSFTLCSEDPPTYSVVLSATEDEPPELRVTVVYESDDYPETMAPTVRLEHFAKNRRMPTAPLLKEIMELCEEQIGMHSIISVLQKAQEYLTEFAEGDEKAELQKRGEALGNAAGTAVVQDPTIRIGNAVTRELFEEWSQKRRAERLREREANEKKVSGKLTGRQLWDAALRNTEWDLFCGSDTEQDVDLDAFEPVDEDDLDEQEFDLDE
ncbi:hypothetical protein, conserved [Trypanosoma brucei gambiense DAL972]|uniref:RWD domain-containing protein n=3 Tax=Trypanosoma brucei TaxID=5691 RepID=Q4GZ97_TRYB2|nr:hypothetical protein, conserved [Trypanosoma brucei brucei TREU927]XP_011771304.1 hypothetical protein, conserved [Trypanosoma brucei gambiense DAL972]RHW74466.1 RWD domain-containing protein [Trypanosoma brucei equiperdum]CAJ16068.1 hypothetical protein, conserved [Trypanosoma brucei brucei TREU927]CBH08863.1 hypothetical protein, conserved [Trypanosoma brucei gambiense DAL972]|eukprot:XP_011771304.1 hypothetical protein, conserved [Trypanosoma brucei gambiense DAL972]